MLGALRDEVVPEVLGGRPAAPEEAAAGAAAEAAEPAVDDTGDVSTPVATPDADAAPVEDGAEPLVDAEPPVDAEPTIDAVPGPAAEAGPPAVDDECAAAVDLARAAADVEAGRAVGEHLGVQAEDALTLTHFFASPDPAYVGWRWAVTVARAEGTDTVTVDEVVLLPGTGALLAPAWVPYSERVQPGDLGTGDLLPPEPDDLRLVPAYADPEADLAAEVTWELGLGRVRVLSLEGRADAAERWYEGDTGPRSPRALAAPGRCADCGFLVLLAGALRQGFGVCANASAPDDGRVVALGHGCGAHSETPPDTRRPAVAELVVDEVEFEFEEREGASEAGAPSDAATEPDTAPETDPEPAPDPLPDPEPEEQAEELGHS